MPITAANPFKGRHYPGELTLLCVRWYLRFPLAYEHVAEIVQERGVQCKWMPVASGGGVKAYAPS
jgi:hypothetical protein